MGLAHAEGGGEVVEDRVGALRPFLDGLELVEPGLVYANDWRADEHTETNSAWHTFYCGGVGRKP